MARLFSARMTSLTSVQSRIKLTDGHTIPCVGFGVYNMRPGKETEQSALCALKAGYRHLDTANIYGNEKSVGDAIKKSGIPREELFVTTKLWDNMQGYDNAIKALESSLSKLGLDYVDLYLIHSPNPGKEKRLATWKAMEKLQRDGKIRSIGVSNYGVHHIQELPDNGYSLPAVNQIEITPYLARPKIVEYCQKHGIQIEAYSPLTMGTKLSDPKLKKIADKYNQQPANILIRWSVQHGYVPLPKSVTKERILSNMDVFSFEISKEDMETLDGFDEHHVTEWDPTVSA
ncbi:aldo/keto reductase [Radiomyces spectabilis]|uniref:aldo/keto reductase n=1 Tax=Radiomyces spectabilis TaxID=64574 RepID=UPI00221F8D61|nr:aldo/keto reductase [Radiomyces spectabilis]KAI8368199.1 aldo/keto reductase [Radiomyces spectabilis]